MLWFLSVMSEIARFPKAEMTHLAYVKICEPLLGGAGGLVRKEGSEIVRIMT